MILYSTTTLVNDQFLLIDVIVVVIYIRQNGYEYCPDLTSYRSYRSDNQDISGTYQIGDYLLHGCHICQMYQIVGMQ